MIKFFILSLLFSLTLFASEGLRTLNITELEKLLLNKSAPLFLYDVNTYSVRTEVGIIPGARLLELDDLNNLKNKLPNDLTTALVFYCANKHCSASDLMAKKALSLGYLNVSEFGDGIYGWQKAGKRIEKMRVVSPVTLVLNSKKEQEIFPIEANELVLKNKAIIVDVREIEERQKVIKNAWWFPTSKANNPTDWKIFLSSLPKNKKIIFHCAMGVRSQQMAKKLISEGYEARYFKSPDQWKEAGLPVEIKK